MADFPVRRRRWSIVVATVVAFLLGGIGMPDATAEEPTASTTSTSQTTTTTTTSPAREEQQAPPALVPAAPSPAPPSALDDGAASPPAAPLPDLAAPEGDDTAPPPEDPGFPAHLQALQDSVVRTPSGTTHALIDALAPLLGRGLSPEEVARVGFGRFPVAGRATYTHDWWFSRFGPGWRLHQGTDIFAASGTPVRAPVDGIVRISDGGLGGLAVYVTAADGTYFYLAHLAGTAPGLVEGATVATGDLVGYVGDSGNARGGLPHVHFEVHPRGGGPVDPKLILDRLLADAVGAVPYLLDAYATDAAVPPDLVLPEVTAPDWSSVVPVPAHDEQAPGVPSDLSGDDGLGGRLALSAPLRPVAYLARARDSDLEAKLMVLLATSTSVAILRRARAKERALPEERLAQERGRRSRRVVLHSERRAP